VSSRLGFEIFLRCFARFSPSPHGRVWMARS